MAKLKILGLIGARSGSRGVPGKSIRPLGGKPLMAWIIEAAKASKYLDRVILSTDSEEYAAVGRQYGAETPFLRPKEIAGDKSQDIEYINHALEWLRQKESFFPDIVLRMLPTVPFQTAEDIDCLIEELLKDPEADSGVVIAEARQNPAKALKLVDDGKGGNYVVNYFTGRGTDATPTDRQRHEKAYFRANIIASRVDLIKRGFLQGDRCRYHIIPQERAVDIDNEVDFSIAEQLMNKMKIK